MTSDIIKVVIRGLCVACYGYDLVPEITKMAGVAAVQFEPNTSGEFYGSLLNGNILSQRRKDLPPKKCLCSTLKVKTNFIKFTMLLYTALTTLHLFLFFTDF